MITTYRIRFYFYYLYIAFTLGAAATLLIPQSGDGSGSNAFFSAAWIFMHAFSAVIFLGFRTHSKRQLAVVALIGVYIVSSAAWSASPLDTVIYGGMAAGNILTAYMIARDLSLREIMLMSARVVLLLTALGMTLGLLGYNQALYFDPHNRPTIIGTHPVRGLFSHKITASLFASLGAIACLACYRKLKRTLSVACLGIFVVLTGSSTGLVVFPISVAIFYCLSAIRRIRGERVARWVTLTSMLALAIAASILGMYIDVILSSLGRDPTLTGRTLLWEWGIQTWLQSPILGWGFNGYFNGPDAGAISAAITSFENYSVPHFHQSYIQTGVDLGLLGIVVLIAVQISIVSRAWRSMRAANSEVGTGALATIAMIIFSSLMMFTFITYNNYVTLIMFALLFSLHRPEGGEAIGH